MRRDRLFEALATWQNAKVLIPDPENNRENIKQITNEKLHNPTLGQSVPIKFDNKVETFKLLLFISSDDRIMLLLHVLLLLI